MMKFSMHLVVNTGEVCHQMPMMPHYRYWCEFPRTTQCQHYPTFTPLLPHLRCGGIDAAPHPHGPPEKVGWPTKRKVMGCLGMPAAAFDLTRHGR